MVTDTTPKGVATRICDFAVEQLKAAGLREEEWLEVFLDAENLMVAEHDLVTEPTDLADTDLDFKTFDPEHVDRVNPE